MNGIKAANNEQIRHISHEIKNQLSICDLYAEIIKKYCLKNDIKDEIIINSVCAIKNAIGLANINLLDLKNNGNFIFEKCEVKDFVEDAITLTNCFTQNKNIEVTKNIDDNIFVNVDRNKIKAIIINIIKNACEAFSDEEKKFIKVRTEKEQNFIKIQISNNAKPITEKEKIFENGFTTKAQNTGFGLNICRENIQKMNGELVLLKSDEEETVFEIKIVVRH